jgi:hypothetical protein
MAKCKLCKTNIPDGTEYCNDCLDKKNSNETYLDSLLNSVKNTAPTAENTYNKKSNSNRNNLEPAVKKEPELEQEIDDYDMYRVDLSDIEDFDQFIFEDDLANINKDIVIGDEELFGEKLSNIFEDTSKAEQEYHDLDTDVAVLMETSTSQEQSEESLIEEYDTPELNIPSNEGEEISLTEPLQNNVSPNEIFSFQDDDNIDADINNLLNSLDFSTNDSEASIEVENKVSQETLSKDSISEKVNPDEFMREEDSNSLEEEYLSDADGIESANMDDLEQMEEDDEFLSLLNQISADDPVSEDVMAINDLLNGVPIPSKNKDNNTLSDVGEVFSDALKVVSSLDDPDIDESGLLNQISDKKGKKGKKDKGNKKQKKEQDLTSTADQPKKGFFQRLFDNIGDEDDENKPQKATLAKDEKSVGKQKPTKKKTGKKVKDAATNEEDDESLDGKKPGKNKSKKSSKKDKEERKKRTKEIIQVIDEIEEDEGRINRLGASIVFLFFGLLVLMLLAGTNVISYSLSIQNATNYFEKQKYTQAYNEVYGIEIKDEDIEFYDKIMTVMFVNKQLNSYNNYYSLAKYPEALDSLLKGLKRYDKYIELATILGIKTDLDYVRNQILAELENVFNLSEKDALQMLKYDSMDEYSLEVYDVVLEKMNN